MDIVLTFDYELFFGSETGTVEKCMIEPTERLLRLFGNEIKVVFFVDIGYLVRAGQFIDQNPALKKSINLVRGQIKRMVEMGHDVQLHVHPHWERSHFLNGNWIIQTLGAYRLDDFSDEEISRIVREYKAALDEITGYKTTVFRAGGWCIQPFERLSKLFLDLGITIDSSVIPGFKYETDHYKIDFSTIVRQNPYRFSDQIEKVDPKGSFIEYPISSFSYSPFFFWKLYIAGRLYPMRHKMIGDGNYVSQPGRKLRSLTSTVVHHVSCDGYFSAQLESALRQMEIQSQKTMVIIGHPKGMTEYSFEKLSEFIQSASEKHTFVTFKEVKRI